MLGNKCINALEKCEMILHCIVPLIWNLFIYFIYKITFARTASLFQSLEVVSLIQVESCE